ncbi:MAG: twin-arginine translocase subunit TatC [Thermoleophilia bacterium]|nr:twin-arginine translocase subunit TatC [Thermoleophilia bacterium]
MIALGSIVLWLVVTFAFRKTILAWLAEPLDGREPVTLSPAEPFLTSFNVALYAALALSLPVIAWQLWAFLAPAFEPRSQTTVVRLVAVATVLLAAGMAFAYWVVLPAAVEFLLEFDSDVYNAQVRAREYYGFAAAMLFVMGLLFELPIFVVGLVRLGVLSAARLRRNRRIGYGICVVAAVLLPGVDFVSMALQALPIVALFELSIWASVFFERRTAREPA